MLAISELRNSLSVHLHWNKARLSCLSKLLLALITVRTVNLRECAVAFQSPALVDSRYKRLKRFFSGFQFHHEAIARWIFHLFAQNQRVYLTIDRTNWRWGKSDINVLTLAIAHEGMAIPLFWLPLSNKGGSATAKAHQAILERFICLFGQSCIQGVLADREFASGELFQWLYQQRIPFYIRIRDNTKVRLLHETQSKTQPAVRKFRHLNPKDMLPIVESVDVYGVPLFIAGARSEQGELMMVVTNQPPQSAIAIYLRRWEIETLFSCLKTRGFRFESTHMTRPDRIGKLMAVLAIAVSWAHKIGEWRAIHKPIVLKRFKQGGHRPQYSYFRYGLDYLRDVLLHPTNQHTLLKQCIRLIKIPNSSQAGVPL